MPTNGNRRVAVTGMGFDTCLGGDPEDVWTRLARGDSGIRPITLFDASSFPCNIAGEVDFDPKSVLSPAEVRRTSRFQQLLVSSVSKAVNDAHLSPPRLGPSVALVIGTGGGGFAFVGDAIRSSARATRDRLAMLKVLPNMAAALVAAKLGIEGPCWTLSTACSSSTDAIGMAFRLVKSGAVRAAIAGGVEAYITDVGLIGFARMGALSARPASEARSACRPFDVDRDGMVPAEGAGALVLEAFEDAIDRDAEIIAEVKGWGSTCDAGHLSAPQPSGEIAARAMALALQESALSPSDIDHVNLHGTSTTLNDVAETRAMRLLFGSRAYDVPMSAPKSMIGHASGACGVIETVISILSIRHQYVPPTINLERPDPECDLDYTAKVGRNARVHNVLKANFGLGGQNSALVLSEIE